MGLLTLIEDRPTPKNVYNWRVYFSAAVAASAAVMIGYDSAFIGGTLALSSFKKEFHFEDMSTAKVNLLNANIVSCYQAGAFFGAFFAYPAGHFLGRRIGLLIFSALFCVGAGIMLGSTGARGLGLIYGGRVLAGIGVGGTSNLSPIYCSEIAPPAIRGRLVGLYELSWQLGGLIGFWINYAISETMAPSHRQWLIPFAIQLIPAGLLFAGAFLIRESPRWLFTRARREQGIKNLCWLRQLSTDDVYMQEEIMAIDNAIEHQRATIGLGFWRPFAAVINSRQITYRFLLGGSLFLFQNGSGINAVNYYSPTVSSRLFRGQYREKLARPLTSGPGIQIHRHHGHEHLIVDDGHLRCDQDSHNHLLAFLPDRQARTSQVAHVWWCCRLFMHVVHWRLYCHRQAMAGSQDGWNAVLWRNQRHGLLLSVDRIVHSLVEWHSMGPQFGNV